MERAFEESKEDPLFGLWAALGLELLARSAVSHISPTLLAEPDKDHRYLLHALGCAQDRTSRKSVSAIQVIQLCSILFNTFSEADKLVAIALVNRRNEELHSGACAFAEYPSAQWLAGFYSVCKVLCECQGKTLEDLFGDDEAGFAKQLLSERKTELKGIVESKVAAHRKVFENRNPQERAGAVAAAEATAVELSHKGFHKVKCPACSAQASIKGELFGAEKVTHEDGSVVVRQPVSPRSFQCSACGLSLDGYGQLEVAGLGGRYSRMRSYLPEDYFGFYEPEDDEQPMYEYNNE